MLEKKHTTGALLLATGHPYFGRMAFNLACSIKAAEPDMPVAIVYKDRSLAHLSEGQLKIFDQLIEMPDHVAESFGAKLYLYDLSPFDRTLYMDVDMLWLPKKTPSELIEEFGDAEFTAITEGYYDLATDSKEFVNTIYYFWALPEEVKSVYKLTEGRLYQWRSEVMYFVKSPRMKKFWAKAQAIHKNSKLKSQVKFVNAVPDELGINVSAAVNDVHPHKFKWTPAYWHKLHRDVVPDLGSLSASWYLMSFGGNYMNQAATRIYDQIMSVTMKKLGRQHVFGIQSKKSFDPERAKM